ncbi:MAG: M48 family metalloprotease [Cyanobacteriota bacterium]
MVKTTKDYYNLISDLEPFAKEKPGEYRFRVVLLSLLSYVFLATIFIAGLFVILLLLILMLAVGKASIACIKFLIPLFVVLYSIVKSLKIQFDKPFGLEVKREDVRPLYDMVDELRESLVVPKIHKILIDYSYNAYIAQIPRLGIFGFPQNYLVLGLPLMQSLTYEEFKSIVAHELGHLSEEHGKMSSKVYSIKQIWSNLLKRLEQESSVFLMPLLSFARWYVPFYNAYTFALSRQNEYEADSLAAKLVGVENVGQAMINSYIKGMYHDTEYWSKFYKQAINNYNVPQKAITLLVRDIENALEIETANKNLDICLAEKSSFNNVHPSLTDRLKNIGYKPKIFKQSKSNAAIILLEKSHKDLVNKLDESWAYFNKPLWEQDYRYYQELKAISEKLIDKALKNTITLEEAWELAVSKHVLEGKEVALSLYEIVLDYAPDHSHACYRIGKILLSNGDENGIKYINKAIIKDYSLRENGLWELYNYFNNTRNMEKAEYYHQQYLDILEENDLAEIERLKPLENSDYKPHNLSEKDIALLVECFEKQVEVKKAYIALRELEYVPEKPYLVIGVDLSWGILTPLKTENHVNKVLDDLTQNMKLPENFYGDIYLSYLKGCAKLHSKLKKVPEALIYER